MPREGESNGRTTHFPSEFLNGSCPVLDLVDELRLIVFPVLVGGGKRFFSATPQKKVLRLAAVETFPSGVTVQTYRPIVRIRR